MSQVLVLLMVLLTSLAWAQENDPVGAGSTGDKPNPVGAGSTGDKPSPVGAGSTGDGSRPQGGSSPVQPAPTGGDPFDYESSEQISEDLSVSFPVDI